MRVSLWIRKRGYVHVDVSLLAFEFHLDVYRERDETKPFGRDDVKHLSFGINAGPPAFLTRFLWRRERRRRDDYSDLPTGLGSLG